MSKVTLASLMVCAVVSGCSNREPQGCTDDCGGYFYDPLLVRKVVKDTGLPICEKASIFQTSRRVIESGSQIPEYAVQTILEGYCPASSVAQIDAQLNESGTISYETPLGRHVSISVWPFKGYAISVWWTEEPNVRFPPSADIRAADRADVR